MPGPRPSRRVALACALALAALLAALFGPLTFRVLQAWRHHGPERAKQELLRYEPPWRGPRVDYARTDPEAAGLDPVRLDAWTRTLAEHGTDHLLLVRGGRLVHEWMSPRARVNDLVHVSALAKGSAGTPALGVAIDLGLVRLDDPAWRSVPAWRDDPVRSRIRLGMLANHTSGIQNIVYGGDGAGLSGWEKEFSDHHEQRFPLTLERAEVRFPPGSRIEYTSLAYYALSYALTRALRGSETPELRSLLARRVYEPLEIPEEAWEISYGRSEQMDGLELYTLASGAAYTPRALARIGELFLGDGSWRGRPILAPDTLRALLSDAGLPQRESHDGPLPAYGWWLNRDGTFPSLPPDAALASGASHRLLAIVPSLDLVVVRLGSSLPSEGDGADYWGAMDTWVFAPLMEAVR